MDENCSFVPKNVHLVPKNQKICTFYSKNEVFAKNFTKTYKFWIKTVVLYPKMYIWSRKKKFELFTLKMKFLPKHFTEMYKFWIKSVVLYPKMYIWSPPKKKICTFYSKNEVFAKTLHWNVQILDKKCSFVPKNVHLVPKKQNICIFYSKN